MSGVPTAPTLWAIIVCGGSASVEGAPGPWSLGTIDTATGQVTFIGRTTDRMDGLAATDAAEAIPTLDEWAQIVLVGILAVTAIWMMRRRLVPTAR
jgi:hypothetical protein